MKTTIRIATAISCPNCGSENCGLNKLPATVEIRGISVPVTKTFRRCAECGTEFENSRDADWRLNAYGEYRAIRGYVTPEQIKSWRSENGLTQAEVGNLLGFGEATLGRYEAGSLQTDANNAALARIMTPHGLVAAINERPDVLSADKRKFILTNNAEALAFNAAQTLLLANVCKNVNDEYNGNRIVSFSRVSSFVSKLADCGRPKTVLNKLMFYSDFLAYREHGQSISGLCYARLPYGPVPNNYNSIFGVLSAAKILVIEPKIYGECMSDYIRASNNNLVTCDFSHDEQIMRYVIRKFDGFTANQISEFSHKERAWKEAKPASLISYTYAQDLLI